MTVVYGKVVEVPGQTARRKCISSENAFYFIIRNCFLGLNNSFWPIVVMCWSEAQIAGVSVLEEKETCRSHSRLQCWVSSPATLMSWQPARMSPSACPQSPQGQNTDDKEYFLPFCPPWWPQSYLNSLCNDAESPIRVTLAAYSSFYCPSHARALISICRKRIVLNITIAGIMYIFIAHLSSLNLKILQVLITVPICFYHGGCFSSQSNGPRSLSLIFGRHRSDHKVVQTRWEVCLSKVVNSFPFCPALAHQICCNCVFNLHLAFFWFKLESLWGRSHMAPSGKGFNPSAYISQETHMKWRGNDLSHIHVRQGSITATQIIVFRDRPLA